MTLTQSIVNKASQGFRALFLKAYGKNTPKWTRLAMETTSTGASEVYDFLVAMPFMKELIGETQIQNLAAAGFTILNKEFTADVKVKRAQIERDNRGIYAPAMAEMGRSASHHPDHLIGKLLDGGFTQTDYTGSPFFANNKKINPGDSSKGAKKFSNKMTAALDIVSFNEAEAMLRKVTDAKGHNMGLGDDLLLVVPPALKAKAMELRDAKEINGTTNTLQGTFKVEVLNELTSDTAWFLMEDGREVKPLIVQYEVKPQFNAADSLTDSTVIRTHEFVYQVYDRKNAGYGLPQLIVGSTGEA